MARLFFDQHHSAWRFKFSNLSYFAARNDASSSRCSFPFFHLTMAPPKHRATVKAAGSHTIFTGLAILSSLFIDGNAFQSAVAVANRPVLTRTLLSCPLSATTAGVCSKVGSDPNRPQKVNQDAYFVKEFLGYTSLGVLDGHGLKGHVLTEYLAKQLPNCIQQELERSEDPRDDDVLKFEQQLVALANLEPLNDEKGSPSSAVHTALVRAFHQAHVDAMNTPTIPAGRSGTTCIVCLKDSASSKLHVAYVGDSRAILVKQDFDCGDVVIEALTEETTIKAMGGPSERSRIEQGEGRIDDNGNVWYGPQGIAMTRSLGNAVMLRAGVVPTPFINSIELETNAGRIVMATDGVWDVLSDTQVADLVGSIKSAQEAAEELEREARRRWIGDMPFIDEAKVDDITCMIIDC